MKHATQEDDSKQNVDKDSGSKPINKNKLSLRQNELKVEPGYCSEFPVDKILSNPFSFRVNISEGIDELVGQIYSAGMIIEPLIGRPAQKPGYVEVGPGERRLYAAKQMAIRKVPIIVKEFTDSEFDSIRFLENEARKDLSDMERARALDYMLKKYPAEYPTQEALAQAFGKDKSWISHHLAMLQIEKIPELSRDNLARKLDHITERQAREILSIPAEKREVVAKKIAERMEAGGEIPSAREIHDIVHPEAEMPTEEPAKPSTSCELCGKLTSNPFHSQGKYYCEDCTEKALAKSEAADEYEAPEEYEAEEPEEPSSQAEFDVDKDVGEGLVSDNVKWILRNSTGDINYQTTIPLLTDEELEYCLEHEKRKTGLRQLETEKRRRENLDETPDFHGTALTGRHCPVCNHLLTQETYDRLKTRFSGFRGLFR